MKKSYYDFMDEISKEELYEKLVRYGLFTDKLPDFLETETFWIYCQNKKHNFVYFILHFINYFIVPYKSFYEFLCNLCNT